MQPETIRIASLKGTFNIFVWLLWHQAGAQYSAGATTSAVMEVCKVSNEVLQLVPSSFLNSATRKDAFVSVCASGFCMFDNLLTNESLKRSNVEQKITIFFN